MMGYIDADEFAEKIKVSPAFNKVGFDGNLLQRVVLDLLDNMATEDLNDILNRQKAEVDELRKENSFRRLEAEEFVRMIEECRTCAIQDFAEGLCKGRVLNDPVVIAVKAELKIMGVKYGKKEKSTY